MLQPNYRRDNECKLKVEIPNFSDDLDTKEFLDLLTRVDRFVKYTELPEDKKVKIFVYTKGGALV